MSDLTDQDMLVFLTKLKLVVPRWAPSEINHVVVQAWRHVLEDFDKQTVAKAFSEIIKTEDQWPAPAKVKRLCQGSNQSDEEIAAEVAARIDGAIHKFGYTRFDDAMAYIGEVGQEVVRMSGGWQAVCDLSYDQLPAARKMWRDVATQVSRRAFAGRDNAGPALPKGSSMMQKALNVAQGLDRDP